MLITQNQGRDIPSRQDLICDIPCSKDQHREFHGHLPDKVAISCGICVPYSGLQSPVEVSVLFVLCHSRAALLDQAVSPLADHNTSDTLWG